MHLQCAQVEPVWLLHSTSLIQWNTPVHILPRQMHSQLLGCPPEFGAALCHDLDGQISQLGRVEACTVIHPSNPMVSCFRLGQWMASNCQVWRASPTQLQQGPGTKSVQGSTTGAWQLCDTLHLCKVAMHIASKATRLQDSSAGHTMNPDSAGWPRHWGWGEGFAY